MNLIQQLSKANPRWRTEIHPDPLIAAVELGLIDEEPSNDDPVEVNFEDSRSREVAMEYFSEYEIDYD
jgi:hypothetical protein